MIASNSKHHVLTLGRFSIVGLSNTLLTFGVYAALLCVAEPHIAIAVGYLVGVLNSYIWNTKWTFKRQLVVRQQFFRFILVNIILLVLNEEGFTLLSFIIHPPLLTQAINTLIMTAVGYALNRWIVYPYTQEMKTDQ